MKKPRITIVGLGLVGNSIGLALKAQSGNYEVVGHDKEPEAAGKARKMGAVDGTEWNLISACEAADLVVLALPVAAIKDTLATIASELKPGCIVTDTATVKEPVMQWAAELLPESVSFVGGNPILASAGAAAAEGGVEAASPALLDGAQYCLTPASTADPAAVHTVSDMVMAMGAQPYFLDAAEHDGLMAWINHLPATLGATLMQTASTASSWPEMRRLAGGTFAGATLDLGGDAVSLASLLLGNAENLSRLMALFQERLDALRQMVEAGDEEALQEFLGGLVETRERWVVDRELGRWEEVPQAEIPSKGDFIGSLLGFKGSWAAGRRKKDREE